VRAHVGKPLAADDQAAKERPPLGLEHEEEPLHVVEAPHLVHADARAVEEDTSPCASTRLIARMSRSRP
jgi:hypothetical protein